MTQRVQHNNNVSSHRKELMYDVTVSLQGLDEESLEKLYTYITELRVIQGKTAINSKVVALHGLDQR